MWYTQVHSNIGASLSPSGCSYTAQTQIPLESVTSKHPALRRQTPTCAPAPNQPQAHRAREACGCVLWPLWERCVGGRCEERARHRGDTPPSSIVVLTFVDPSRLCSFRKQLRVHAFTLLPPPRPPPLKPQSINNIGIINTWLIHTLLF